MTSLSFEYRERMDGPNTRDTAPRIREVVTVMIMDDLIIGRILSFFPAPKFWLMNERFV